MDPAEAIFKRLARFWKRRFTGRASREAPPDGAVTLESARPRLEALAALLFGQPMELRVAHDGVGGVSSGRLYLPRFAVIDGDPEASHDFFRVRVAYSSIVEELGFHAGPLLEGALESTLATLLAVPTVRARLADVYPSAAALELELSAKLARERAPAGASTLGDALDAWTLTLAGAPVDPPVSAEVARVLDEALELRFDDPEAHLEAARRILASLEGAVKKRGKAPAGNPLWGLLMPRSAKAHEEIVEGLPEAPAPGESERSVVELDRAIRMKRVTQRKREDKPLFHMFEKAETAEEYGGESGTPDAEGDVREMEDALSEISLGQVIRTTDDPQNLVRADIIMDPNELDVVGAEEGDSGRAHRYPEWDHRVGRYIEGHCTVREERFTLADDPGESPPPLRVDRKHVDALRMHLMRSLYRRRPRNRQLDGAEIDVEAIVERHADLVAGCTPTERLYISPRRALREVAILVLVDTSFSTDAWLDGRRVLDTELQSLLVIGEAFHGHLDDEVSVASFRSHTRHDVRFGFLKRWSDDWGALRRIAPSVTPGGYTRIGAALRHATHLLEGERAKNKLLLLLSDGKPIDYDRYEGRYGVEDVRKAVLEARQRDVRVFGLAVEKEAKLHLARMLGRGSYRILPRPGLLPEAMAEVFTAMIAP